MKILKTLLFILFLLTATNCKPDKEVIDEGHMEVFVSSFPKTEELSARLDSFPISRPIFKLRYFAITDEFVFALVSDKDTLIHVFDTENLDYIGGFGFEGEGPGDLEFLRVNASSFNVAKNDLFIADRRYFRTIPLEGLAQRIKQNKVIIKDKIPIPGELFPFNDAFLFNDNSVFGKKASTTKHLVNFSQNTPYLKDSVEYPNLRPEIPKSANYSLYRSSMDAMQNGKKLAIAYRRFPLIRLYDFDKSTYIDLNYKPKNEQVDKIRIDPSQRAIDNSNLFDYYVTVQVSNKRIYALYEESIKNIDDTRKISRYAFNKPELHVFDWMGKPIKRIIIPEWVNWYGVSPDDSYIFFFHPENENYLYRTTITD